MRVSNVVAACGAACVVWVLAACKPEVQPASVSPPKVLVAPVHAREVELIAEAVGQIDGYVNAEIRARVGGYLRSQSYRDGAQVKADQVLFTIDPVEYEAAVESARGGLARAQAALTQSQAQLARSQSLSQSGTITQRALEDAVAAHEDATGQERVARAALRQAELNLSYTRVRSPIDGIAGLAHVRVGNLVGADGPTLLTTVSQIDPVRVRFPISERDYLENAQRWRALSGRDLRWAQAQFEALAAEPGAPADAALELVLADGRTYERRGVVIATDREVDPSTGTIQVEALFPNPDGVLRPGLYARVRMRRGRSGGPSLVVAQKALLEVQGTYSLAVVGDDNKVQLRRVEVGPVTGDERVITKGVSPGERVVVEGVQKVRDGAPVAPEPAQPEARVRSAQLGL